MNEVGAGEMRGTPDRRQYTRNEVVEAERYAWAGPAVTDEPQFFFDSISFWRRTVAGDRERVLAGDVPAEGWWHRAKCNCKLCREHAETSASGRRHRHRR